MDGSLRHEQDVETADGTALNRTFCSTINRDVATRIIDECRLQS
jgi:hypothetical protein